MVLALAVSAQDNQSVPAGEYWYKMTMQGQSAGYIHIVSEKIIYHGKDCYKSTTESVSKIKNDDKNIELKIVTVAYEDLNFNPLYLKEEKFKGSQKASLEVLVSDLGILFRETNFGQSRERRIEHEKGVLWGISGGMLKAEGLLKVGTDSTFKIIDKQSKNIGIGCIKILRKEKLSVRGKDVETFYAESRETEFPGVLIKNNFDGYGVLVRQEFESFVLKLTDETDARNEEKTATISSLIQTNISIPFVQRITRMQIALTIDTDDKPEKPIPDNEYQIVKKDGDHYDVWIKDVPLEIPASPKLPVGNNKLQKYLIPSSYVQSDDPAIAAKAKEIVRKAQDDLEEIKKLSEWVYRNIGSQKIKTMNQSAKETLETKVGDCTEHAALFCAFARAIGVPTRIVQGLMFTGEAFGFHQWNEVYLNQWIPVDTTCNRIGIPALYLKTGEYAARQEEIPSPETESLMLKMIGRTSIKILTFQDNANQLIDLSEENRYFIKQNSFIEDKRAGLKLYVPPQWKSVVASGLNGILLSHAGKKLSVTILYLDIQYKIGDSYSGLLFVLGGKEPVQNIKLGMHDAAQKKVINQEIEKTYIISEGNGKAFLITFELSKDTPADSIDEIYTMLRSIEF
jgi:hypothetical protein